MLIDGYLIPPPFSGYVAQADVGGYAIEPGRELTLEFEAIQRFVYAKEDLLIDVFCLITVSTKAHGNVKNLSIVATDELLERLCVSFAGFHDQLTVIWPH
jgi:hypothetical protein